VYLFENNLTCFLPNLILPFKKLNLDLKAKEKVFNQASSTLKCYTNIILQITTNSNPTEISL
jgi:hypothetical protein